MRAREAASRGKLPNFTEGCFLLVTKDEFYFGQKLAPRWRGPRRIIKAVSDYFYTVEDLRNGIPDDVHTTCVRFYLDKSLDTEVVVPHVLHSDESMPIQRLLRLKEAPAGNFVVTVLWYGLLPSEDTEEPLSQVSKTPFAWSSSFSLANLRLRLSLLKRRRT